MRSVTKLKIVIKGVMTPEDAATAAWEHRVDGIWVSNHGARQVDTAPATIEVCACPEGGAGCVERMICKCGCVLEAISQSVKLNCVLE